MNPPCITCGTTHDGEFCPKPPQPVLSKDSKPMINKPAEDAYRVASYLGKLYTRLDVAREAIAVGIDNTPSSFDRCTIERLMAIRDSINREIGLIFDLSEREAHRICNQLPESSPAENLPVAGSAEFFPQFYRGDGWADEDAYVRFDAKDNPGVVVQTDGTSFPIAQFKFANIDSCINNSGWVRLTQAEAEARVKRPVPADPPDDWVTQDLVPPREQIDQVSYTVDDKHWNAAGGKWGAMHGADFGSAGKLLVRCRRKDLPTQNRQLAASDSPAPPKPRIAQTNEHFPVDANLLTRALEIAEFTRDVLSEMETTQRDADQYSKTIKSQIYIDFISKKKSLNFRLINDLRKALGFDQ